MVRLSRLVPAPQGEAHVNCSSLIPISLGTESLELASLLFGNDERSANDAARWIVESN